MDTAMEKAASIKKKKKQFSCLTPGDFHQRATHHLCSFSAFAKFFDLFGIIWKSFYFFGIILKFV